MLLRFIAFALLALPSGLFTTLAAQGISQPTAQVDTDKIDSRVFAILFKRENAYLKLAKATSSPDSPEAQLGQILPTLFQLDPLEANSLQQFAGAWEAEVIPLRAQMTAAIAAFHSSLPNGHLNASVDPTPPPAIAALRAQIDTLTLQYRDNLRNAMPEPDFQSLQAKLRESFGGNIGVGANTDLSKRGGLQ